MPTMQRYSLTVLSTFLWLLVKCHSFAYWHLQFFFPELTFLVVYQLFVFFSLICSHSSNIMPNNSFSTLDVKHFFQVSCLHFKSIYQLIFIFM